MLKNHIIFILITLLCLSSCAVIKNNKTTEIALIEATLPTAVGLTVASYPSTKIYFNAVSTVIDELILNGTLDYPSVAAALKTTKINELQTPIGLAVTNSMLGLYKTFYAQSVANEIPVDLKTVLTSISAAFKVQ
jgi:uncharacterized membrane protein YwzB